MGTITDYVETFSHLHTAKIHGHKAPHKALLLLSIIELIESGDIVYPQIVLTNKLVDMFNALWLGYLGDSALFKPDITKPFFHMQHEPFWNLVEKNDMDALMVVEETKWEDMKKKKNLPSGKYTLKAMRETFEYAEIDENLFNLLQNQEARELFRTVLIESYLDNQSMKTIPNLSAMMGVALIVMMV